MSELTLVSVLSAPGGPLDLESGPYELEKGTMAEVAVTWRKNEVDNPHVEDTFVTQAVRNAIVRPLNVWVTGADRATYEAARDALEAALSQLTYTWQYGVEGITTTWRCKVADYSIVEQHEYVHSFTGLVRAMVPTSPTAIA